MLLPHPCPLSCPLLLLFAWSLEPGNLRQAWAMAIGRKVRDTGNQGWKEGLDQGSDPFRSLWSSYPAWPHLKQPTLSFSMV